MAILRTGFVKIVLLKCYVVQVSIVYLNKNYEFEVSHCYITFLLKLYI